MDLREKGDVKGIGGVEAGKTVHVMYCMREESNFNKKIKNIKIKVIFEIMIDLTK